MLLLPLKRTAPAFTIVEVMVAISVVAIACAGLFTTYGSSLGLVGSQQEMISANLCLEQRLDQVRALGIPVISSAARVRNEVLNSPAAGNSALPDLVEEIKVSAYPPPTSPPAPVQVQRQASGTVAILSDPGTALASSSLLRVDVRATWQRAGRPIFREVSALVAVGGISR